MPAIGSGRRRICSSPWAVRSFEHEPQVWKVRGERSLGLLVEVDQVEHARGRLPARSAVIDDHGQNSR
jgi:hypothetical protein